MVELFVCRFGLEFGYSLPPCGTPADDPSMPPEWWFDVVGKIHYLHFGIILFVISGTVTIIVSLVTPPIAEEHLHRLTFWTRHSTGVRIDLDEDKQYSNDNSTGNFNGS